MINKEKAPLTLLERAKACLQRDPSTQPQQKELGEYTNDLEKDQLTQFFAHLTLEMEIVVSEVYEFFKGKQ